MLTVFVLVVTITAIFSSTSSALSNFPPAQNACQSIASPTCLATAVPRLALATDLVSGLLDVA
jgi:hypothetical protein